MAKFVRAEIYGHVLEVTLDRPPANAMQLRLRSVRSCMRNFAGCAMILNFASAFSPPTVASFWPVGT
jgi:hypothetical protein